MILHKLDALIEGYSYKYVIADKVSYDSDAFIAEITSREAIAVIPPRKNRTEPRTYDKELYKRRNLIERFFGWLKQYRRVEATRYDNIKCSVSRIRLFRSITNNHSHLIM